MQFWRRESEISIEGRHAFYFNALFRGLASSLVSVFTPIYIYVLVSEWRGTLFGVSGVALYYLGLRLTVLVATLPISRLIERIGFRRSVMLSVVLGVIQQLMLYLSAERLWVLALACLFGGLMVPLYWIARHSALAQDSDNKKVGKTMGTMIAMEGMSSLLGPFVGGVIIFSYGYQTLYLLAMGVVMLSVLPLWLMPHHTHQNGASLSGFLDFLSSGKFAHQGIGALGLVSYDYGGYIFWPVVMAILGLTTQTVGTIFSLAAFFAVVIRLATGRYFDRLRAKGGLEDERVFLGLIVVLATLMFGRIFVSESWQVGALEMVAAVVGSGYLGFALSYLQLGGKRMKSISYFVYYEMIYSLIVIGLMTLVLLGVWLGIWKEIVFSVSAGWILLSIVQARESNMR